MAFVYRTEDKINTHTQTPGPGTYLQKNQHKLNKKNNSSAPFNNSSNRQIWQQNLIPGPGSYVIQNSLKKQKKLIYQPIGQIAVYEAPKQSVSFKSKTMRFTQNVNKNIPGPGQYQVQLVHKRQQSAVRKQHQSTSELKNFLKQKNQIFRNNINQQQFQKEMIISASQNINLMGQYEDNAQVQNKKSKNSIFFSSKVQRQFIKVRPQTSAGPGSYNIAKSSFQIAKRQQKRKTTKSICLQKKTQKVFHQDVGPGYYDIESSFKKLNKNSKKKKLQCFGSTVDRFNHNRNQTNPGPSSYQTLIKSQSQGKINSGGNKFSKQQRKVFQAYKHYIGPGYYQVHQNVSSSIQQKNKSKLKTTNKCYFGSSKQRFSHQNNKNHSTVGKQQEYTRDNNVGQNYYNFDMELCEQNKLKNSKTFKTLLKYRKRDYRSLLPNKQNENNMLLNQNKFQVQKPLCYDNISHTLSYKYHKKRQIDAPFLSGAQRFKQISNTNEIILVQQPSKKPQNSNNLSNSLNNKKRVNKCSKNKQNKPQCSFGMTDTRFKYLQQANKDLGPQYYNPNEVNKKSYNVLFN